MRTPRKLQEFLAFTLLVSVMAAGIALKTWSSVHRSGDYQLSTAVAAHTPERTVAHLR